MPKHSIAPESCRICLRVSKKSHSIYATYEEGDEPPFNMLIQITGLSLESKELKPNEPQRICRKCELSLNMAFEFRKRALKSQKIIENYQENLLNQSASIMQKIDDTWEFTYDISDISNCEESDNKTCEKFMFESVLQAESTEEHIESEFKSDNEDEILDEIFLDSEEPSTFKGTIHLLDQNDDPISDINYTTEEFHVYLNDDEQQDEEDVSSNTNNNKTPPKSKEKLIENHLDTEKAKNEAKLNGKENKQHFCDICGNMYGHRGRMLEHRRRHEKTQLYECEICQKSFNLRENMRKHMMTHCGNKPFKCNFCSRTFYYESVKKAHEAVHTGAKPYVCTECNKAFAYAHALKKHQMIHNEIKLFHCMYCNKDFRLSHHMKQHEQTRLHQNAVSAAKPKRLKYRLKQPDREEQEGEVEVNEIIS